MSGRECQAAGALAAAVAGGATTAERVMEETLDRIAAFDRVQPQVWISRPTAETLLREARAIDARLAAGEQLPLAGVPYAAKDNIDVEGLATTAACPAFAYHPAADAEVIRRLRAAGAICVGKTNLDQFATGLAGTRSPYGIPRNPCNRAYVSGGSSSGSAVAVAAGLVPFALGTDTAGSGRVPAAFNHLLGLKPTRGRWSTQGVVPACRTIDCVSAFTTSVVDARLIDSIAAGFDPADPFSRETAEVPFVARRVGVPRAAQRTFFGDREAEALYEQAIHVLGRNHAIVEIDMAPLLEAGELLYGGPWVAERAAAAERVLAREPEALEPTVRAILSAGQKLGATAVWKGLYRLAELRRAATAIWQAVDVLALPTTGTIYRVEELLAEPVTRNTNLGRYTSFVNLLDMAAVAVPAAVRESGTGFGISLIGPAMTDLHLLDMAEAFREQAGPLPLPPLDLATDRETIRLAVVGAHLSGMPLHGQLTARRATLVGAFRTAPCYRLYAMPASEPPRPALVFEEPGAPIEVEVYELGLGEFGRFVADVPPPLAIGTLTLADGTEVKGFVAEPRALKGAEDITRFGGWRAYVASR